MAKLSCRVEKYQKPLIAELERHSLQSGNLQGGGGEASRVLYGAEGGLQDAVSARIEQRAGSERAVRKDAVVLCEVLVTLCGDWCEEMGREEMGRLLELAAEFLRARYQEENCMYTAIHTDEGSPHLHFGFVPMTREGRLSAKRLIDRIELQRLQSELPQHLRSQGYQIERATEAAQSEYEFRRSPAAAHHAGLPESPVFPAPRLDSNQPKESADIYRDNQNLRLENLLLERQLRGMIETIKSDPQLELLYMRQLELQTRVKRELHQMHEMHASAVNA